MSVASKCKNGVVAAMEFSCLFHPAFHQHWATTQFSGERRIKLKDRELGLIQGFLLCLCDSEAVRLQTSRWKRSLLVFSSGVCLEIAALPCLGGLLGYQTAWHLWVLTGLFAPLGLVGLYASKYGHDRLVECLLVIPKLDLRW